MRRHSLFIVGALLLAAYGQAVAGAFEDATAAYKRGDYTKAVELIRPLAEHGDVRAQFNLATIYYNGQGARQDLPEAAKWFRMAAEQGDMQSQRYLGFMYASGKGLARDDREAITWYGRAAEQGDADAQVNLGVMYSASRGTSQNYVQAHKWFSLAAAGYPTSEPQKRDQALKNSERIASKMSQEQLDEARKLAREWHPRTENRS
jgi:TPR repeat protein